MSTEISERNQGANAIASVFCCAVTVYDVVLCSYTVTRNLIDRLRFSGCAVEYIRAPTQCRKVTSAITWYLDTGTYKKESFFSAVIKAIQLNIGSF